ncbi:MAG: hypothetical protein UHP28_06340 [Treponema sp.]|nr:hypothetical protein [Treponema sp.]
MFDYFLMGLVASVIVAALLYFKKVYCDELKKRRVGNGRRKSTGGLSFANCPVCGTPLTPGNNLMSKVFRSTQTANDQICYVYGCPTCYPAKKAYVQRACPVCHKEVPQESYLLCRLFNKTKSGKPHVIINGCGNCNRH